jgi:hypothetical protein
MMDHGPEAGADDDQWADVVESISTQNPEFRKMN